MNKQLVIFPKGTLNPKDKERMSKEGYLAIEADDPSRVSAVHRQRISAAKMGDKNPFFRAGSRHPQFGKPKSDTTKMRISETAKLRGSHKGDKNKASRTGVLYDVETGANHLFRSLKPLCARLGLDYKGVTSALYQDRFYKDRFYVSYVTLPWYAGRERIAKANQ